MAPPPELVRFDAPASQCSSVRLHALPMRNGSVALQRRVSNCSSLGLFFYFLNFYFPFFKVHYSLIEEKNGVVQKIKEMVNVLEVLMEQQN